ncbi:unnamed protein product, partial [Thlaspi arvense]
TRNVGFKVTSGTSVAHHVSLDKRTCTCPEFKMLLIPCQYAIAAITINNLSSCGKKHCRVVLPVPNPDDIDVPTDVREGVVVLPPKTKHPLGRPPTKKKFSISEIPVVP